MAYQLALQAQKSRTMAASAASMIETKSSKPVPKPRVGMRKSAVRAPPPPGHPRARVEWPQPVSFHSLAPVPGEQPTLALLQPSNPYPGSSGRRRRGHRGAAALGCRKHPVTPCVCLSVCFALCPRCRYPPILAVVTVTPAPLTVLPTYRCRPLVPESRSFRLPLSCVSGSRKCP